MRKLSFLWIPIFFMSCFVVSGQSEHQIKEKVQINSMLNQWHSDVAESNFDAYFEKMSESSIFIGTDADENWTIQQFKDFAKPHFDKKKTWDFKTLERNVYFNSNLEIAWFDELLNTWMGVCRGSGVLIKINGKWKIEHYVLSIVIPNDNVNKVVEIKKEKDDQIIQKFKNQ